MVILRCRAVWRSAHAGVGLKSECGEAADPPRVPRSFWLIGAGVFLESVLR